MRGKSVGSMASLGVRAALAARPSPAPPSQSDRKFSRIVEHLRKRRKFLCSTKVGSSALSRKYPGGGREWGWQWVFRASKICISRASCCARRRGHRGVRAKERFSAVSESPAADSKKCAAPEV